MDRNELFSTDRSPRRLNEALSKLFGKQINFENFDQQKLEDARNRLRTQLSQCRSKSGFNENLENDNYHKAQFMLDAINAEFARRETMEDHDKDESEKKVTEGEIQQASAIVAAKQMVDRVGRWIEELSSMENDSLLQLGDQIRDEMGLQQSNNFLSTVAPVIQTALETLKTTRETLSTGVRILTGEEEGSEMLGAEAPGEEEAMPAEPDAMNQEAEPEFGSDEFATAEPSTGGEEAVGREQRESVNYQNRLLKVLAG
jgi:hypothetical protein